MFAALESTTTPGRCLATGCWWTTWEKTGNIVWPIFNTYLLHWLFVALWRKPGLCRCLYGQCCWVQGSSIPMTTDDHAKYHWQITLAATILLVRVYDLGNQTLTLITNHRGYIEYWIVLGSTPQDNNLSWFSNQYYTDVTRYAPTLLW